ncbi:unnamed protein product [Meloidogyne enterolobii]|uniref:Uncharacterized protein n=1 Tax=Meloidogyne enterolobii TaxID=390850 RepID=A0ACB1B2A3_MELEN
MLNAKIGRGKTQLVSLNVLIAFESFKKDDDDLMDEQFTELENCIWNSLLAKEHSHSPRQIHPLLSPPPEYPLKFSVENLVVEQVDTLSRASMEFNVFGHILLSWNDSRLQWEKSGISLEEDRRRELWTPDFMDDSYPEERNDCCLFLGLADIGRTFTVGAKSKFATLAKRVHVRRDRPMSAVVISNLMETSPWASQAIEPARVDGSRSDSLRLCVQSKKEMSTLRIALRIPVTIATLLTLVSPLFGDLRTQALVKCLTLLLQTICFLFLCSIAPASGFGGSKPKLYTFYEFMFTLTFLSILVLIKVLFNIRHFKVTTVCLALSRMKRTVPATHSVYLGAKMLNHFLCCIEPDPATSYQRHLEDDTTSTRDMPNHGQALQNDYSMEWRHIYIAINNLFSGLCFSLFCFIVIFDIM